MKEKQEIHKEQELKQISNNFPDIGKKSYLNYLMNYYFIMNLYHL